MFLSSWSYLDSIAGVPELLELLGFYRWCSWAPGVTWIPSLVFLSSWGYLHSSLEFLSSWTYLDSIAGVPELLELLGFHRWCSWAPGVTWIPSLVFLSSWGYLHSSLEFLSSWTYLDSIAGVPELLELLGFHRWCSWAPGVTWILSLVFLSSWSYLDSIAGVPEFLELLGFHRWCSWAPGVTWIPSLVFLSS